MRSYPPYSPPERTLPKIPERKNSIASERKPGKHSISLEIPDISNARSLTGYAQHAEN